MNGRRGGASRGRCSRSYFARTSRGGGAPWRTVAIIIGTVGSIMALTTAHHLVRLKTTRQAQG